MRRRTPNRTAGGKKDRGNEIELLEPSSIAAVNGAAARQLKVWCCGLCLEESRRRAEGELEESWNPRWSAERRSSCCCSSRRAG